MRQQQKHHDERQKLRLITAKMTPAEHALWMRERALAHLDVGRPDRALGGILDDHDLLLAYPHGPFEPSAKDLQGFVQDARRMLELGDPQLIRWLIFEATAPCLHEATFNLYSETTTSRSSLWEAMRLIKMGRYEGLPDSATESRRRGRRRRRDIYNHPEYGIFGIDDLIKPLIERGDADGMRALLTQYFRPPPMMTYRDYIQCWSIDAYRHGYETPETLISDLIQDRREAQPEWTDDATAARWTQEGLYAHQKRVFEGWFVSLDWPPADLPVSVLFDREDAQAAQKAALRQDFEVGEKGGHQ